MDSVSRAKKSAETRRKKVKQTRTTTANNVGKVNQTESKLNIEIPFFDGNNSKEIKVEPTINSAIKYTPDGITIDSPGFNPVKLDDVLDSVHVPNIQKIDDVINPNIESKATEAEHAKAIEEYKGGIRYQELIEWSNNYTGSQYKALASAVKAAAKGVNAAVELEKFNHQFIELQKQSKITHQKGFEYVEQSYKTAVIQAKIPYSAAEQIAVLNKQKAKAEKAFHEAKSEEEKAREFIANLGTNKK